MQVADTQQLSTSATLGARETINFGITDDAAFFQILSANLYSNQKLAFVREVICNDWDAHIEAGKQDIAIQISFDTDNNLIFKDFGNGIPHNKMGEVYGTYGASTKKTNTQTTGGFGLGCKSPFAYTDSFRVVSCNEGTKTIYNITKSSVETEGKPGIVTITSMPTDETGLTVIIPIDPNDRRELTDYIFSVVYNGEMKAEFKNINETEFTKMNVLGMSFEPGSYAFNGWYKDYMGNHTVFIRYGNVIYPALDTPATRPALDLIEKFLNVIGKDEIVVQAAPSTLALTPSREALSSQKMTENGLVDICTALVNKIEKDIIADIPDAVEKVKLELGNFPHQLGLTLFQNWVNHVSNPVIRNYLQSSLGIKYRKHYLKMLFNTELNVQLNQLEIEDKHKQAIKDKLFIAKKYNTKKPILDFIFQYGLKPMLRIVGDNPDLNMKDLRLNMSYYYSTEVIAKNFKKVLWQGNLENNLNLVRNKIVFITSRLSRVNDSVRAYPEFEERRANYQSCFIYRVATKAGSKDRPIEIFEKAGYTVVDLTLNHSWDPNRKEKVEKAKAIKEANKVPNGLIPVENIIFKNMADRNLLVKLKEWEGEIDKPEWYVDAEAVFPDRFGAFCPLDKLTPEDMSKGVAVRNGIERAMAKRRGAVNVDAYFFRHIMPVLLSKEMKIYLTKERQKSVKYLLTDGPEVYKMLEELNIKLKDFDKLRHDPALEEAYNYLLRCSSYSLVKGEVITEAEGVLISQVEEYDLTGTNWYKQIKRLVTDPMFNSYHLNPEKVRQWIKSHPERKAALKSLVLSALKTGKNQ